MLNNIWGNLVKIPWFKKIFAKPDPPIPKAQSPQPIVELLDSYTGAGEAPEVLYFGDSVLFRVAHEDKDKTDLGHMVVANLRPFYKTCCICHGAYTARNFYYLARLLKVTAHTPKLVILPINMRSFSPQWDYRPVWQFEWEIGAIESFIADPKGTIPKYPEKLPPDFEQARFESIEVNYLGTNLNRIGQFTAVIAEKPVSEEGKRERWKTIFIFHYMHKLSSEHRTLLKLIELATCLSSQGIRLLIYITPVNYEAGKRYVGQLFDQTLTANVELIKHRLARTGCSSGNLVVADWSRMLGSKEFFHDSDPTEHLNEQGRKRLAEEIAAMAKNLMVAGPTGG
jgi:hypothetical protein